MTGRIARITFAATLLSATLMPSRATLCAQERDQESLRTLARAEDLAAGLMIDSTLPLDTAKVLAVMNLAEVAVAQQSDSTTQARAAKLLFQTAMRLMVQRMAYPIAARLFERAVAHDDVGALEPESQFWHGAAIYFTVVQTDSTVRRSTSCATMQQRHAMIAHALQAFQRGRRTNPPAADAYIAALHRFETMRVCLPAE